MRLNIQDIALLKTRPFDYYMKSYSHSPHLADLPGDLNSLDKDTLQSRYDEVNKRIKDLEIEKLGGWEEHLLPKYKELDKKIHDETEKLRENLKVAEITDQLKLDKITDIDKWIEDNGYYTGSFQADNSIARDIVDMKATLNKIVQNIKSLDDDNPDGTGLYDNWDRQTQNTYLLKQTLSYIEFYEKCNVAKAYEPSGWNGTEWRGTKHKPIVPPNKMWNRIKKDLNNAIFDYDYQSKKIVGEYDAYKLKVKNELRDYRYHKERIERHCRDNGIKLNTQ